jgi:hypothetical protein
VSAVGPNLIAVQTDRSPAAPGFEKTMLVSSSAFDHEAVRRKQGR